MAIGCFWIEDGYFSVVVVVCEWKLILSVSNSPIVIVICNWKLVASTSQGLLSFSKPELANWKRLVSSSSACRQGAMIVANRHYRVTLCLLSISNSYATVKKNWRSAITNTFLRMNGTVCSEMRRSGYGSGRFRLAMAVYNRHTAVWDLQSLMEPVCLSQYLSWNNKCLSENPNGIGWTILAVLDSKYGCEEEVSVSKR